MIRRADEDGDGLLSLVKETADGLGRLIADHIKLARVEMVADAKDWSRKAAMLLLAAVFVAVGYTFAWLAAAVALGRLIGVPLAFLAVAVLHLLGGALGLRAVSRRMKGVRIMNETASEVSRSVSTLAAAGVRVQAE